NPPMAAAARPGEQLHVDLFRTAGQPLMHRGDGVTQDAPPRMVKQASTREWTGSGKYNKVRQVGKGAFAVVYKVTAKYDGRPYAAKELEKRHFIKNGVLDQKVENEMRIMQRLNHPNIVRYIENFDWDERLFIIIMEFVAHGDLGKLLHDNGAEHGPLNERTTQVLAVQLLSALRYLHNFSITHRDIKPDNILVSSLEPLEVKLTDFGLSKMIDSEQTFLRTFCGTLLYCAPEVYTEFLEYDENGYRTRGRPSRRAPGQRYSHAVDIWSLGGVLFYCLTGAAPYPARSVASPSELLHRIMTTELNVAPLQRYGVSEAGIDFIRAMLTRRPEHRATVDQLQNHPWLTDFGETIQASQSFDEVTDDEEFPGQASQFSQGRYEDDRVSDSMDEDSDQENRTIVPGRPAPRLFGEVGVSAIGSSGVIPEEYLNLSPGNGNLSLPGMSDPNIDEAYNSGESSSERSPAVGAQNPAGLSIFPNQSMDQLPSLVEEIASQSLGGDDKKSKKSESSPRRSMTSLDLNSSKRKPPSADTSDEFDENTPPAGKPTIKRLRSDGHVDALITDAMLAEYKLLASVPPIHSLGTGRSSDWPVIKAQFWTDDISTWHLEYPEMTELQLAKFKDAAAQRKEVFRPGQTPLWELAMKYFPPTPRPNSQAPNPDSPTLSLFDSLRRGGPEAPATGPGDGISQNGTQEGFSQLVVPIPTSEMAAMIESDLTSCIRDISIPITEPLVSFGRGPENTKIYEHKAVTKVPKYAFKILLWKDGYDPGKFDLPWRSDLNEEEENDFFFWISTKATNGIRINGRQLSSSSFKSPHDPSQHWTRLYNRDSIVIWHDGSGVEGSETKLTFHCTWGGSARVREATQGLELASAHVAQKLNAGCQRFENQRPKNRMRKRDEADITERRKNVERERQRNVWFEEKRQEAIAYFAASRPAPALGWASRRHSPAGMTMAGRSAADSTARFSRR
ncbi:hypothetical protein LLEC1_05192, partial [Akanthomyces lecanii]